jgi:hypothetical protein
MFAGGQAYLLSISEPVHYANVNLLRTKETEEIRRTLLSHCFKHSAHGIDITRCFWDGEPGTAALIDSLDPTDIRIERAGPETHVGLCERTVRSVKVMARYVILSCPFNVPVRLFCWVVYYVIAGINMLPTAALGPDITPRENLTGR